jgi:hypothetical protein
VGEEVVLCFELLPEAAQMRAQRVFTSQVVHA